MKSKNIIKNLELKQIELRDEKHRKNYEKTLKRFFFGMLLFGTIYHNQTFDFAREFVKYPFDLCVLVTIFMLVPIAPKFLIEMTVELFEDIENFKKHKLKTKS